MADADAEEVRVQQARQLPYPQRLSDRNWKIRRDAFEDIKVACSGGVPADASFGERCAPHTALRSLCHLVHAHLLLRRQLELILPCDDCYEHKMACDRFYKHPVQLGCRDCVAAAH